MRTMPYPVAGGWRLRTLVVLAAVAAALAGTFLVTQRPARTTTSYRRRSS
jgi:hypothetical protein